MLLSINTSPIITGIHSDQLSPEIGFASKQVLPACSVWEIIAMMTEILIFSECVEYPRYRTLHYPFHIQDL